LSVPFLPPYPDFLLHDMGSLGDGIVQGQATGREMRTAPLWGLRRSCTTGARIPSRRPSSRTTDRAPRPATASRACPPTRGWACSRISGRS